MVLNILKSERTGGARRLPTISLVLMYWHVASTSSSNCRNLPSWVSSWRLCSSRIFIRASSLVLCCLSRRASASMSLSTSEETLEAPWGSGVVSSGEDDKEKDMEGDCWERNLSYSACKVAFSSSNSLWSKKHSLFLNLRKMWQLMRTITGSWFQFLLYD